MQCLFELAPCHGRWCTDVGRAVHESHVRRCKGVLQTDTFVERAQVAVTDFAYFSRQVGDWVAHQSESLCARSALLAALEILHECGEQKFEAEYSECLAAYPGATFQCDELIGCVYVIDCDTRVFEETSDNFADWKNKPVLCSDAAANVIHNKIVSAVVHCGQARGFEHARLALQGSILTKRHQTARGIKTMLWTLRLCVGTTKIFC